jgi:hypothetical protein
MILTLLLKIIKIFKYHFTALWVGLSDRNTEGKFVWEYSGQAIGGQVPDNNELYDCVFLSTLGAMTTHNCDKEFNYICEKPANG